MNEAPDLCCVCGEALLEDRALCNMCGREYHLALRMDRPAPDCGDAWIDDEVMALVFGCNACLGRGEVAAPVEAPESTAAEAKRSARRRAGMSAREVARGKRRPGGRS